jgi:hypothetical protein
MTVVVKNEEAGVAVVRSTFSSIPSLLDVMPPPARKKSKLVPKRHHWYGVLLFILGTLFPPLGMDLNYGLNRC